MDQLRQSWKVIGACALAVVAAACGSSGTSGSSTPSATPKATSPMATSPATSSGAAAAAIAANWAAFFDNKTPVDKRVDLLQDGPEFASIIKAQAGSGLASEATAKVTKVTQTSADQATVTYEILIDGTPALKNKTGVAVYQDGTWKVGASSFCGLLILEQLKSMPATCESAG
jgi:hypothetical protein